MGLRARLPYLSRGRSASYSQNENAMCCQAPPPVETSGTLHANSATHEFVVVPLRFVTRDCSAERRFVRSEENEGRTALASGG
jgi:hypothetical protein